MKVRGTHIHHSDDPWKEAPPWAIELVLLLGLTMETTMPAIDDLTGSITALGTAVSDLKSKIDAKLAQVSGTPDAQVQDAKSKLDAVVSQLQAISASLT